MKVGSIVIDRAAHEVLARRRERAAHRQGVRAPRLPRASAAARSSRARSCSAASGATATRAARARSTSTCAACARSSAPRCRSRRCAAPATSCEPARRRHAPRASGSRRPQRAAGRAARREARATLPVLAVSVGCPSGVGPEVAVAAPRRARGALPPRRRRGRHRAARRRAAWSSAPPRRVARRRAPRALPPGAIGVCSRRARALAAPPPFGAPRRRGGRRAARVDRPGDRPRARAASPPRSSPGPSPSSPSRRAARPGASGFRGHTEHLAERLGAREVVMAFASTELDTALVTTHLPLARRARPPSRPRRSRRARTGSRACSASLGSAARASPSRRSTPTPARAACSATRRRRASRPASRSPARGSPRDGVAADLAGPIGAETAFRLAARGELRRRGHDVPRPGHHPVQAPRLRRGGERDARRCPSCAPASITGPRTTSPGRGRPTRAGCARPSRWRRGSRAPGEARARVGHGLGHVPAGEAIGATGSLETPRRAAIRARHAACSWPRRT